MQTRSSRAATGTKGPARPSVTSRCHHARAAEQATALILTYDSVVLDKPASNDSKPATSKKPSILFKDFMIQIYSFFGLILAVFLNPQQTKFFGGLAIDLKQTGFFLKYKTAENFIYFLSWLFMICFFKASSLLA